MITRFSIMPTNNVILGLDAAKIFKPGVVYQVTEILDEITLTPLGEMHLPTYGHDVSLCSDYKRIIHSGLHLMTKEEIHEIYMNKMREDEPDPLYDCTDCSYDQGGTKGCGHGLREYGDCGDHSIRGTH